MAHLGRNASPIAVILASVLLWGSFAWGLSPGAPAKEAEVDIGTAEGVWRCGNCDAENVPLAKYCTECGAKKGGEAEVAPKDPWAGVRISDAYDYAKCPYCGKKNGVRAKACARCGNELPQPSGEDTYPPWVFVPGKGYYREGMVVEPAKTRKGLIITGCALIAAGAAILGVALAGETDGENLGRFWGGFAGACVAGAGGVVLVLGYATRKDAIYALNPRGVYGNESNYTYARRSPDPDGPALKVEVTLLGF